MFLSFGLGSFCGMAFFFFFFFFPHISGPSMCLSHFPRFSVFCPHSRSYSVHFSFSTFLSVSRHIPGLFL